MAKNGKISLILSSLQTPTHLFVVYCKTSIFLFYTLILLIILSRVCLNDGSGCSNLGYLYGRGKGVKQDDFKTFKFYLTTFLIIYPNPKIEIKKTH
jgi:TPR repeat protein